MVQVSSSGSWDDTISFLEYLLSGKMYDVLDRYGRIGVDRLSANTPVDTGETAHDWLYTVEHRGDHHSISWYNVHRHHGVNIAVILQYGHGTGTGGWVEGRDYINPAIQPVFDKMVEDIWSEVRNA